MSEAAGRTAPLGTSHRAEGLAALSGILLFLSFPKFGHWSLAWIALAPLLIGLQEARGLRAARLGYVAGAVSSLGLLYWTSLVMLQFGGISVGVASAIMVALCLAVALFPALFAWVVSRWLSALGPPALLAAPAAWVATELLRRHLLFSFPWCLLGYSQQPNLPFIQVASITGVYGVSFVLVAVSGALAFLLASRDARSRRAASIGIAALVASVGGFGAWRMARSEPLASPIRVGLVQGAVRQDEKWEPTAAWDHFANHVELTRQAVRRGARLVVWPESSLPFRFDDVPEVAERMRALAREGRSYLLFGNDDRTVGASGSTIFVGAKMLDPEGRLVLRYHKMQLVPFGEYVPLKTLFTLGGRHAAKLVQEVSDFTPGEEAEVAAVDGHAIGAFICYEAIFPDLVRRFSLRGARLLVNITNDAWYGFTSAPHQHLAMAAFRAVESGLPLVRAANTGISAVVDPLGRVSHATALFERTVVVADVPPGPGATFYSRHGDVFAWSCMGLAAALSLASRRRGPGDGPR
jgi:apolipoprotein N-acyltransferase